MSEIGDILMPERALNQREIDLRLNDLAKLYRQADGPAMRFLNRIRARADQLFDRLPDTARKHLTVASESALMFALRQASGAKPRLPLSPKRERMVGAALGALGGAGGIAGTMAELPVTTVFLLRIIQEEARSHGFDPTSESVRFDSIRIFGAPGPFGAGTSDAGFWVTRLGLGNGGMQKLVVQVAPRLGVAMGQKMAAQAVPIIGSAAGATCNYVYAGFYQNVAKIHYSIRQLSVVCDIPEQELRQQLVRKIYN